MIRLLLGVLLTFLEENRMTGNRTQTASWIAYSILQFVIMFVSVFVYSVVCFNDSLF